MSSSITMGRRVALIVALITGLLYGCAANKPPIGRDQLTIEKISSDNVAIGDTYVRKSDGSIDITGKVKFRWATAGTRLDMSILRSPALMARNCTRHARTTTATVAQPSVPILLSSH